MTYVLWYINIFLFTVFESAISDYHTSRRNGINNRMNKDAKRERDGDGDESQASKRQASTPQSCQSSVSRTSSLTSVSSFMSTLHDEQLSPDSYAVAEKPRRTLSDSSNLIRPAATDGAYYSDDPEDDEEETQRGDGHHMAVDEEDASVTAEVNLRLIANGIQDPSSVPVNIRGSSSKYSDLLAVKSRVVEQVRSERAGLTSSNGTSSSGSSSNGGSVGSSSVSTSSSSNSSAVVSSSSKSGASSLSGALSRKTAEKVYQEERKRRVESIRQRLIS